VAHRAVGSQVLPSVVYPPLQANVDLLIADACAGPAVVGAAGADEGVAVRVEQPGPAASAGGTDSNNAETTAANVRISIRSLLVDLFDDVIVRALLLGGYRLIKRSRG
jgi:hypothetical protein